MCDAAIMVVMMRDYCIGAACPKSIRPYPADIECMPLLLLTKKRYYRILRRAYAFPQLARISSCLAHQVFQEHALHLRSLWEFQLESKEQETELFTTWKYRSDGEKRCVIDYIWCAHPPWNMYLRPKLHNSRQTGLFEHTCKFTCDSCSDT
jgi:hypothetical protein